jgi:hypothetical protein
VTLLSFDYLNRQFDVVLNYGLVSAAIFVSNINDEMSILI